MPRSETLRVVEYHAVANRPFLRSALVGSIVNPVLFLAAMGLGLGSLIEGDVGGVDYLAFVGSGLLAAAAMQTGCFESLWPVMAGIKWRKSYDAMLATTLTAQDIAVAHIAWATIRVAMTAVAFLVVMVLFGAVESWWALLAFPAAVLTGTAHAAPLAGVTASLDNDYAIANIMRFGVVPMFLFSGTFFPVEQLPDWIEPLAYATPLWHGVELCRSLALGDATLFGSLGHVAYLLVFVAFGAWLTQWRFEKRLVA